MSFMMVILASLTFVSLVSGWNNMEQYRCLIVLLLIFCRDAIVSWVKKKTGPGIYNLLTVEKAGRILTAEPKVVLGFLDSLVGPQSEELSAASRLEEDVSFYQTSSPEEAKVFHIDPRAKHPALVLLKKETEKISHFDGQFTKSAITQFVYENKLPLLTTSTRESAPLIFENPIKNQLSLFATSNDSETFQPMFQEAAKAFKGKLDFQLPSRFNLAYSAEDEAKKERPVMIDRAILGSVERMLAILLEHYKGKWPFWLSPRQAIVCPVSKKSEPYALQVKDQIHEAGFYIDVDTTDRKIQKKYTRSSVSTIQLHIGCR